MAVVWKVGMDEFGESLGWTSVELPSLAWTDDSVYGHLRGFVATLPARGRFVPYVLRTDRAVCLEGEVHASPEAARAELLAFCNWLLGPDEVHTALAQRVALERMTRAECWEA